MLPQQVADARSIPSADSRVIRADIVLDDEGWVVSDPGSGTNRADEEVDLLA